MELMGLSFLGGERAQRATASLRAWNPATGEALEPAYSAANNEDVERAAQLAAQAFPVYAARSGKERAAFLRRIADGIDAAQQTLAERAHLETALPMPRLLGEAARTSGQLRLFATLLEEGSWVDARIDTALPERKPLPRPGLRSLLRPVGPVAVFGASNFPLAFSAAGGDTASALAAGCPVIVKAHSAHPGTSEIVASVIQQAVRESSMPEGVFSLLYGAGAEIGAALVQHPGVRAVAFTGSLHGGRALMDMAALRPQPIPCFTEMSAENPVFVLPGAMRKGPSTLAQTLFQSFTLGAGQFCTKPGLVFYVDQPEAAEFLSTLQEFTTQATPFTLLTQGIAKAYSSGATTRDALAERSAQGQSALNSCGAQAQLHHVSLEEYLAEPKLAAEIFGPTTLLIRCASIEDFARAAALLQGQLTATILGNPDELETQAPLIALLQDKAGRLLFNGMPTGVEVSHAMVHGGPYPAASDARFTSVGTQAIFRFVRPVCFQNFPESAVPEELQYANPLGILRLVNGAPTRDALPL